MAQETNQSQAPLLCSTGCGLYGSPRNNGMCSVCYKDFLQRQCVGSTGSSSESNIGECFLAHSSVSSNSTTVMSQTATSPEDAESGPCSALTTASATSTEESTPGATTSVTAASLHRSCMSDRAGSLISEQEGQYSAGSSGTVSSTRKLVLRNSTTVKKSCHKGKKRKVEELPDNIDEKRASASQVSLETPAVTEEKPKVHKNRCFMCRKKVGLTGFSCRCGDVFCSIHRYSDVHNCTFDYKADAAEKIRKENPVVVGEKIRRI